MQFLRDIPLPVKRKAHKNTTPKWKALTNTAPSEFFRKDRVCIFHHIPKCGGTSVINVLGSWFFVVEDYRPMEEDERYFTNRIKINSLKNYQCLSGHFDTDGIYLHQRYPEVFTDSRFKTMTFVRDPLKVKISLYYFEQKYGLNNGISLEKHLMGRHNYIANRLPCTRDNYREALNSYFFVGITEFLQESMDQLASLLNKPTVRVPMFNPSGKDGQVCVLSQSVLEDFKDKNELDYLVYQYCLDKHRILKRQQTVGNKKI